MFELAVIHNWGIGEIAIGIIVAAAIIGVVLVIVRTMGVAIPSWFITILWILLAAVVGVIAIRFLMSL